ncbi:MAG: ELM1/GtrOC1 family putative glycosyltransferase [Candidatus Aceula meridiana]|nr:ELM1/GtrOC1 family putative glycosyltransferase [Candidatus Aceula meridiana]
MKNEFSAYWAVKFFATIVRALPLSTAIGFGRFVGLLGYYLDAKHKKIAYSNLKIAFAKTKKTSEIKRILRELYRNFGQHFIELLRLPITDPHKYIKVEGKEYVDEAIKKGKGVILLAMHFGSWELCNFMESLLGHPYRVMVNPQARHSRLNDLLNSYRQSAGAGLISTSGSGARDFLKTLKKNEIVGIVVDQGGKTGELVKFFGRLSSMSVGAIKIGLKFDVPIYFCTIVNEKGPYHRLIIQPALDLVKTQDINQDVRTNLENITKTMEECITRYPSQYMWLYKIWKYSKESTVVILNDKRTGHLRQSQAVAQGIAEALTERGIQSELQVIDVEFKDEKRRRIFSTLSFLTHEKVSQGRLRYLKWFLKRKSFLEVMSVKGDFVISCGSSTSGVNYFLSQDYRAKSIVIQRPGALGMNRFDLAILPEHDRGYSSGKRKNVVFTKLAPNLINPQYLKNQTQTLLAKFTNLKAKKKLSIGILLGGESKNHTITYSQAVELVRQLKNTAQALDMRILLTTSRRTPKDVDEILERELKSYPPCELFINAKHNNVPEAVGGILGLCDIIIASSDSISMVSEAVSSGKKVIVFLAQQKNKKIKTKHEIFVENLKFQEHVFVSTETDIGTAINQLAKDNVVLKPIEDQEILLKATQGII